MGTEVGSGLEARVSQGCGQPGALWFTLQHDAGTVKDRWREQSGSRCLSPYRGGQGVGQDVSLQSWEAVEVVGLQVQSSLYPWHAPSVVRPAVPGAEVQCFPPHPQRHFLPSCAVLAAAESLPDPLVPGMLEVLGPKVGPWDEHLGLDNRFMAGLGSAVFPDSESLPGSLTLCVYSP